MEQYYSEEVKKKIAELEREKRQGMSLGQKILFGYALICYIVPGILYYFHVQKKNEKINCEIEEKIKKIKEKEEKRIKEEEEKKKKEEERRKEEEERRKEEEEKMRQNYFADLKAQKSGKKSKLMLKIEEVKREQIIVESLVSDFFSKEGIYQVSGERIDKENIFDIYGMKILYSLSYKDVQNFILKKIMILKGIKNEISYLTQELEKKDKELRELLISSEPIDEILYKAKKQVSDNIPKIIFWMEEIIEVLRKLENKNRDLSICKMMDETTYGKNNGEYWNYICNEKREKVINNISICENIIESHHLLDIEGINVEDILSYIWFLAIEKVFSASDFRRAESIFLKIYKDKTIDLIIAELYSKLRVGGENAISDYVRELLKKKQDVKTFTLIASALMWMKAYRSEHMVLQHMLKNGMEMTPKMQERLHSLSHGGGKIPDTYEVKNSRKSFYFDISALAWKEEEYVGLFESLIFQDKQLEYALAVRDEDKDLFIADAMKNLNSSMILNKLNEVFKEEYGSGVTAQVLEGIGLSGNSEEKIEGILVSSEECKQMGIFLNVIKIGKKYNIKFFTLFIPKTEKVNMQKQQAMSLYKKLSPTVTVWENSLKATILLSIEQLLNVMKQENDGMVKSEENLLKETVF